MSATLDAACRICGAIGAMPLYRAREMLHGTREAFDYFECEACGCVQIAAIPDDLARHYPAGYFSYRDLTGFARNPLRRFVDRRRVAHAFGGRTLVGAIAERVSRPLDYIDWLKTAGLGPGARVLDVGCGAGKTLIVMAMGGLPEPTGLDPFITRPLRYDLGVTVHKTSLEAFAALGAGPFDLVMFHHALEHLVDPRGALENAAGLLADNGRVLVVVPVAGGYAWERYREHWCNLDPPRHLHLLTPRAMRILAGQAGLAVETRRSISAPSQFTGSERYLRDIPANDPRQDARLFSARRRARWRAMTKALNATDRGDQMMFFLRAA